MNNAFKLFIGFMFVVVAGVVTAGFYLVGSPQTARMEKFDQTRVQNLNEIAISIYSYYAKDHGLSKNIEELKNTRYLYGSLNDPETGKPYEYRITGPTSYELCATFSTSNKNQINPMRIKWQDYYSHQDQDWQHDAGRVCFQKEVGKRGVPY